MDKGIKIQAGHIAHQSATIVVKDLKFPEGPAFAPDGSLWLVELHGGSLVQLRDGIVKRFFVGGKPNGIAFNKKGALFFCDAQQNAIRCFDTATETTTTIVNKIGDEALNAPNDLAFDNQGNLVFTCPGNSRKEPTGYVCVLEQNGNLKKITEAKYFPNGLAFTADGKHLVIAETYKQRLWKGDWDSTTCQLTNELVFAETGGIVGPDGMAFDNEGNLYVAVFGSGTIKIFNKAGVLNNEILVDGTRPSNCAFDPLGSLGLVITEAEKGTLLSVNTDKKGAVLFG